MTSADFSSRAFETDWPRPLIRSELDRLLKLHERRHSHPGARADGSWARQVEHSIREIFRNREALTEWETLLQSSAWDADPWGTSTSGAERKTPALQWLQELSDHVDSLPRIPERVPYWSERRYGEPDARSHPIAFTAVCERFARVVERLEQAGYFSWAFGAECVDGNSLGELGVSAQEAVHSALMRDELWPVTRYHEVYTEEDLFDMIEFLADHVRRPTTATHHNYGGCGWHYDDFDLHTGLSVYRWRVNELLAEGDIDLTLSESGRLEQIGPSGVEDLVSAVRSVENVHDADSAELNHAMEQFRFRGSHVLDKRHAVISLAGILERRRSLVQAHLLTKDEGSLFQIANSFGIRHQRADQKTDYDSDLYLEWIFYWYLGTIHLTNQIVKRQVEKSGPDEQMLPRKIG
ncbi:hypothetical protein AB0K12_32500 [Nonomuraea sp. NPDC049419]|uniref:hypothetical protein n=1 Tax=Nonomuraea sp. NPDC049419 TaxID=3155772 RepID=UPI003434B2B2